METNVHRSRRRFGAVDLGAESGRVVVGSFDGDTLGELMERFTAIRLEHPFHATIEEEG